LKGDFDMKLFRREEIPKNKLPGRTLQIAMGKEAVSKSGAMMVGFAHYSAESGPMEPHQHVEEAIYVLKADKGWFRFGPSKDKLGDPVHLESGMILHFPPWEWHVFEYAEKGSIDILFMYSQVDNLFKKPD
jgi:hypothetical protein